MTTGAEWMENFKKYQLTIELVELRNAIERLQSDPMFAKEYSGHGLFDGFPNLKDLIDEEVSRRKEVVLTKKFCKCDPEPQAEIWLNKGNSGCSCGIIIHHYHCPKCGGLTQIG